jgi:hypothetical protein
MLRSSELNRCRNCDMRYTVTFRGWLRHLGRGEVHLPPPVGPWTRTPRCGRQEWPDCGSCSSLAPHHAPSSNASLLPLRFRATLPLLLLLLPPPPPPPPSHAAAAKSAWRTRYPNPGLSRQTRAIAHLIARNPQLRTLARQQHLKAPTFPQRTEEKRRNEHGLIQEAGFLAADGANARRNRGGTPELSSSDHGAARQPHHLHEHKPRARRTKTRRGDSPEPPQIPHCTRGALRTSHAP